MLDGKISVGSAYHNDNILYFSSYVDQSIARLKTKNFDVIACTGVSGLLLAPTVAHELGKDILVIRKDEDKNNHGRRTEGIIHPNSKILLFDDLTDSGNTLIDMSEKIKRLNEVEEIKTKIFGAYLYVTDTYMSVKKLRTLDVL